MPKLINFINNTFLDFLSIRVVTNTRHFPLFFYPKFFHLFSLTFIFLLLFSFFLILHLNIDTSFSSLNLGNIFKKWLFKNHQFVQLPFFLGPKSMYNIKKNKISIFVYIFIMSPIRPTYLFFLFFI